MGRREAGAAAGRRVEVGARSAVGAGAARAKGAMTCDHKRGLSPARNKCGKGFNRGQIRIRFRINSRCNIKGFSMLSHVKGI